MLMAIELPVLRYSQTAAGRVVYSRLDAWAKWAKDAENIGWPVATLLARMIRQGPMGASQSGRPPVSMPDDIAKTDNAIAKLSPIMRRVIFAQYLVYASSESKARTVGVSRSQYWRLLERAHRKLNDILSADY